MTQIVSVERVQSWTQGSPKLSLDIIPEVWIRDNGRLIPRYSGKCYGRKEVTSDVSLRKLAVT